MGAITEAADAYYRDGVPTRFLLPHQLAGQTVGEFEVMGAIRAWGFKSEPLFLLRHVEDGWYVSRTATELRTYAERVAA